MSKLYPSKDLSILDAERLIKKEYGDVVLTDKHYPLDNLTLWFIGQPDKYYQDYVAEMGSTNLVIKDNESVISL